MGPPAVFTIFRAANFDLLLEVQHNNITQRNIYHLRIIRRRGALGGIGQGLSATGFKRAPPLMSQFMANMPIYWGGGGYLLRDLLDESKAFFGHRTPRLAIFCAALLLNYTSWLASGGYTPCPGRAKITGIFRIPLFGHSR